MRVAGDREICMGAGVCVMTADKTFDQDDDGIVVVLVDEIPASEADRVREAVKLCPSQALRLID